MPLTAVDQQDVGKRFPIVAQFPKPTRHHLVNAAKIVDPADILDPKPPVARFKRQSVNELNQTRNRFLAAEVSNVYPLDHTRRLGQRQYLSQTGQTFFRVDVKHFGLGVRFQFASFIQSLQHRNLVAKHRRPLEIEPFARFHHFVAHLAQQFHFAAFQERHQSPNVAAVGFFVDP